MLTIQKPDDLISLTLYNIFTSRKDDKKFIKNVKNWNKKIILHIEPFYPVTVIFTGNEIKFEIGELPEPNLKVKTNINTLLDISYNRLTPIKAMDDKKMELEGLENEPKIMPKFFNIFVTSMNLVAANPNIYHYKLKENTR